MALQARSAHLLGDLLAHLSLVVGRHGGGWRCELCRAVCECVALLAAAGETSDALASRTASYRGHKQRRCHFRVRVVSCGGMMPKAAHCMLNNPQNASAGEL